MGEFAIQFGERLQDSAMIMVTGIIARPIIAWPAASP